MINRLFSLLQKDQGANLTTQTSIVGSNVVRKVASVTFVELVVTAVKRDGPIVQPQLPTQLTTECIRVFVAQL